MPANTLLIDTIQDARVSESPIEYRRQQVCSTLDNFTGSSDIDLNLYVQDFAGNVNGSTVVMTNTNNLDIAITLRQEFIELACPIEITKTILHEAIHAEIIRRFRVFSSEQLSQLYPTMLTYMSTGFDDHHE